MCLMYFYFQVKNLRSQVSRLAIVSIGELFATLNKYMDTVSRIIYLKSM